MIRFVVKNGHQEDMCYDETGLCLGEFTDKNCKTMCDKKQGPIYSL